MNPRVHNTAMEICFIRADFRAKMSPGVATRHAGSVRHVVGFGIEETAGDFRRSPFLAEQSHLLGFEHNRSGLTSTSR